QIAISGVDWNRQRIMPLFQHGDGRIFVPTARRVWERLLEDLPEVHEYLTGADAVAAFDRQWEAAQTQGKAIYDELIRMHREHLPGGGERGDSPFAARGRTVELMGLPAVRGHRLAQLAQEERVWQERLNRQADVTPELVPLIIVQVRGA